MHDRTCTKPSAATCTLPLRMSQRQTYSPSCASVRKFCWMPQEGSVKNTDGPLTMQQQTCSVAGAGLLGMCVNGRTLAYEVSFMRPDAKAPGSRKSDAG
jgi:hypothetical protein